MSNVTELAGLLDSARRAHRTIRRSSASLEREQGYHVQDTLHRIRSADGEQLVGFKVGLTAVQAQRAFSAPGPGYGRLYSEMVAFDDLTLPAQSHPHPYKVECEVAIELRSDITATELDRLLASSTAAPSAIAGARPAAEIVHSRWDTDAADWESWCADNGSAFGAIVGPLVTDFDCGAIAKGALRFSDDTLEGHSALSPLEALGWLAQSLRGGLTPLFPGAVILTGALVGPVEVEPGQMATAEVVGLGSVSVTAELAAS